MSEEKIKSCPYCKASLTIDDLISNPDLRLIGMSFADDSIEWAYYFYQHEVPNCGTSFVVRVDKFTAYITEQIPTEKLALRECCKEHCVSINDLSECENECYFAPFRRLLIRMMAAKSQTATTRTP